MPNIGEKENLIGRKLKKPKKTNKTQKNHWAGFFFLTRVFANPARWG
jgi:hypothetical protein